MQEAYFTFRDKNKNPIFALQVRATHGKQKTHPETQKPKNKQTNNTVKVPINISGKKGSFGHI